MSMHADMKDLKTQRARTLQVWQEHNTSLKLMTNSTNIRKLYMFTEKNAIN